MSSEASQIKKAESLMRDLGIPTEPSELVMALSISKLPWSDLADAVEVLATRVSSEVRPADMDLNSFENRLLNGFLELPIGVALSLTFSDPDDPTTATFKQLKNLAQYVEGFAHGSYPTSLKIKAIRCLVHLYSIAAKVPLAIGCLNAVQILRKLMNSFLTLMNTSQISVSEIEELNSFLKLPAFSFENMLMGEIGYVHFSRGKDAFNQRLKKFKDSPRTNRAVRSTYQKLVLLKALPFLGRSVRLEHMQGLGSCIIGIRNRGSEVQLKDIQRMMTRPTMSGHLAKFFRGKYAQAVFEHSFRFQETCELINTWMMETLLARLENEYPGKLLAGEIGTVQVARSFGSVQSDLHLYSFFGKTSEYKILTSPATLS